MSSVPNIAVYEHVRQEDTVNCASSSHQNRNQRSEKSKSYENVLVRATSSDTTKRHPQRKEFRKAEKYFKQTDKEKNHFYENTKHRTIPSLSEYQLKDTGKIRDGIKNKSRYERSESNLRNLIALKNTPVHCTLPKNLRELSVALNSNDFRSTALDSESLLNKPSVSKIQAKPRLNLVENSQKADDVTPSVSLLHDYTKSKEESHSFISYQYLSSQDEDDYRLVSVMFTKIILLIDFFRSECENCKSSGFTNEKETDVLNETMTLERRPLEQGEDISYYRTSLTLPTNTKKTRFV